MELISKTDAVRVIWESVTRESATKKIDELPTVEERKEGRWIRTEGELICSLCGYPAEFNPLSNDFIETNFCPNCGAKMKGE